MRFRFTSVRERSLWIAAGSVILAIFASVPLGGALVGWSDLESLLGVLFAGLLILAVVAVVGTGLAQEVGSRTKWVALAVVVCYGMLFVRMGVTPLERTHLFEYGIVAVLIHQALRERVRSGGRPPVPSVLALIAAATLGWLDEGLQAVVPNRVYDVRDAATNVLAALVAIVSVNALAWARRWDRRR